MSSTSTQTLLVTQQSNGNHDQNGKEKSSIKKNLPTLEEIRAAVPAQCFEKNLKTSIFYFLLDYAIIAGLYVAVPYIERYFGFVGLLGWSSTVLVLGMYLSSLFIVGHDCGHGTFSEYIWVNDIFGHLAHAPILAPFWPWQKSHRQHHQYTSNLDRDKGHPWTTEETWRNGDWLRRNFSKLPISGLFRWNPVYTLLGLPDGSHFNPFDRMFTNTTERVQCVVSSLACVLCAGIALRACDYSVLAFLKYYIVPVMFQGFLLVMITYLQHQDEEIEVYEDGTWSFVKGQSQTIDRYYGFGIDYAMHHITDGHVAHHFFFTKVPHYHLMEATKAIRSVLEQYPGTYKRRSCYHFLYEFLRLNLKLEYLIGQGTGLLKYNASKQHQKKSPKLLTQKICYTRRLPDFLMFC
uniref:Fatty acid desaturase domain-containing protein n=1 Tax=Ditylenchus dipsaci TaxID=166011 RepID=A0A915DCA4_9BILA